MSKDRKSCERPHTLKQRIRSWLWDFLMEEPPEIKFDHREMARLVKSVGQTATDDTYEAKQ